MSNSKILRTIILILSLFGLSFTSGMQVTSVNAYAIAHSSGGGHSSGGHAGGAGHAVSGGHVGGTHVGSAPSISHPSTSRPSSSTHGISNTGAFPEATLSKMSRSTNSLSPSKEKVTTSSNYTYSKDFMNKASVRNSVYNSKDNVYLGITKNRIGSGTSYYNYFNNPYSHHYYYHDSFQNYWFYYWMWNRNITESQRNIMVNQGIDHNKLLSNKNIYKITISQKGHKKVIIVTKKQYAKIKVGDKIHLFDGKLYVNGTRI